MNKFYFYMLYIPVGVFLIFSIGPYLKNRKYKNDKKVWNIWYENKPIEKFLNQTCMCGHDFVGIENVYFRLPKSTKKTLFTYHESNDLYTFISVRCKFCQTEVGRKII